MIILWDQRQHQRSLRSAYVLVQLEYWLYSGHMEGTIENLGIAAAAKTLQVHVKAAGLVPLPVMADPLCALLSHVFQ